MKKYRIIHLLTGLHYIHHWSYSFGYKIPFIKVAYFKNLGFKKLNKSSVKDKNGNLIANYHNCTLTGIY